MPDRLVHALERAAAVTAALAEGEMPFGALRLRAGLPAPTFSRLVKALVAIDHVASGPKGYRLGASALRHARTLVGAQELGAALQPTIAALARETGESAAFYALRGGRVVLIAVETVADSASYAPVGIAVPEWTRHGFAQACVMRGDVAAQKRAFAACPRRREATWTAFRDQLAAGRRQGAIIEIGQHRPGILRVAAPVGAFGAIGVSSPRATVAHARHLLPSVQHAAAQAARILGVSP